MEELMMGDMERSFSMVFTVLGTLIAILSGFGSLLMLKPGPARSFLLSALILVALIDAAFIIWGINLRLERIADAKIRKPGPRPNPKPSPDEPKVKTPKVKEPETSEETAAAEGMDFALSSRFDPSIRQEFCIDSEVSGRFYHHSGRLKVQLERAAFNLCRYSVDGQRQVQYVIGIGRLSDIARKNWKAVAWSDKALKGSVAAGSESDITPSGPITIAANRLFKKKETPNLDDYGIVVSVYNPDRNGRYFLFQNN